MKNKKKIQKPMLSAMLLAIGLVLPFLTGQIPEIGNLLCPMHIPVILCGYICGGPWGLLVGFITPILRSFIFGMPVLFPRAIAMAFELAAYGFFSGFLYNKLPKKKASIYISLLISMVLGRLVWGVVQFLCAGLDIQKFNLSLFWAGAVIEAIPGIILQIVLIPVLVIALEKHKVKNKN